MKQNMLAMLLALCMLLGLLAGCGSTGTSEASSASESEAVISEQAPEEAAEETTAETAAEPAAESSAVEDTEASEASAEEAEETDFVPAEPLTYPLADGDVTFTILHAAPALGPLSGQMNMASYGDFETIAAGTEYIGVTPEWTSLPETTGETQFNLIVASGDYPDVWTGINTYYTGGFQKALEDEVIIKLDDYIETGMPEYWNLIHEDSELLQAVTNNSGEYLAWYSIYDKTVVNQGYLIRKDWCDLVGADVPTTLDELNDILYEIKSQMGYESVLLLGKELGTLAEAFRVSGTIATGSGFTYHREGDTLIADITSDDYEAYVRQLHQWYEDGIVNKNFSELDTLSMSSNADEEYLANNLTGVVNNMASSMDNLTNDDPNFEMVAMVVTVDGENIHTGTGERQFSSCSISTQCDEELIPYIMGWMNYWYTEEGAMAGSYGVEGVDYEVADDGTISYLPSITENSYGYAPMLFARTRCFAGAAFGLVYQDRTTPFYTDAQIDAIDTWTSRTDNDCMISTDLSLTTEESETVALYATDLATYISEEVPKFVIGDRSLDEWDEFMANCEDMHVSDLLAVYQAAYDRYYGISE